MEEDHLLEEEHIRVSSNQSVPKVECERGVQDPYLPAG